MVLIKKFDDAGFVFFTDSRSPKALALANQPAAAMTIYWPPLDRQVRIQGRVTAASDFESDECFRQRPRHSQITTWASEQSRPVANRQILQGRVEKLESKFAQAETIPRPSYWQAYRLLPDKMEFWVARAGRLHDRFVYWRSADKDWQMQRLSP